MNRASPTLPILLLLICVFSWGSVFPIAKQVLLEMSDLALAIWRFVIAIACLGAYLGLRRLSWPRLTLWQYAVVLLIGALGIGGFNLALFAGLRQTSATNGALIMALSPLTTSLISSLLGSHRLSRVQWLGMVLGLAGVLLVITQGHPAQLLRLQINHGDLLVLLAMLTWCGYTLASQAVGRWLPSLPLTLLSMLAGLGALLLTGLLLPGSHPWQGLGQLSGGALLGVFYIGLLSTVLGYLFWLQGIQALGAPKASLYYNLVPVFAALVALALGQPLSQIQLVGMLVVLLGLTAPLWLPRLRLPLLS